MAFAYNHFMDASGGSWYPYTCHSLDSLEWLDNSVYYNLGLGHFSSQCSSDSYLASPGGSPD
jgi:hypothetical protein